MSDDYNQMSDDYFKLLIETTKTSNLFVIIITRYMKSNLLPCNFQQLILLHFLMTVGGNAYPQEINMGLDLKGIGGFSKNYNYNFKELLRNGFVIQKQGKDMGLDKRCVYFHITDKGKEFYDNICIYFDRQMKLMQKELGWDEGNFKDYLDDLEALQVYLKGS